MKLPRAMHSWRLAVPDAIRLQRRLSQQVELRPLPSTPRLIAGLDAAFSRDGRWCLAAAVLWDVERQRVLEQSTARRRLRFPYIPGLLSFREAPALIAAVRGLTTRPDVLILDGHGLAHPRRFGIACHVGLLTGIPAIGCAKSRLVGSHQIPDNAAGSGAPLYLGNGVVGRVLRTRRAVRPVYVSVGHRMTLPEACRVVLACVVGCRLPEPTRRADRLVARYKQRLGQGAAGSEVPDPEAREAQGRGDPAG